MPLKYFDFMISILIVIHKHANYGTFDQVKISKVLTIYLLVPYLFVCKYIG